MLRPLPRRLVLFVLLGLAVWAPNLHRVYSASDAEEAATARAIAERRARELAEPRPDGTSRMRAVNPEWDFMNRTFTVLAFANLALGAKDPAERGRWLAAIDAIVDRTLAEDEAAGDAHFLLGYAREGAFRDPEGRSLFVDGELVLMIAARDMVEPRPARAAEAKARAARIERAMRRGPRLSAESYPDECWTFCNTTALAGLAMLDATSGSDHGALARDWVAEARAHLVEPKSGLLVSSYSWDGTVKDGPEGSSIWMSAHNLLLVDEDFAKDQYGRARAALGRTTLGFGWAREWPAGAPERPDVDSGPIVPLLGASPGSSGLAILGASAFGDRELARALGASLRLAGAPSPRGDGFAATSDVGEAVILYAWSPPLLWEKARARRAAQARLETKGAAR